MRLFHSRLTLWARILLPPYLLVVGLVVFSPSDDTSQATGYFAWVIDRLDELQASFEPGYVALEFVANIAMFVPLGLLLPVAFARLPSWAVLAIGFATTVTIESVQSTLPSRFSTVSDVVANTLGTAVGLLVVWAVGRRYSARDGAADALRNENSL